MMGQSHILPFRGGDPRSGGGARARTPKLASRHRQDYALVPLHQIKSGWSPSPTGEEV